MPVVPLFPIEAPFATPPRVGLLPTLNGGETVNDDKQVGFTYNPENCGESGVGDPCDTDVSKDIPANQGNVEAAPFYIWAGDKCAPWELGRDWQGRARRQLRASESFQVAYELWTGDQAQGNGSTRYLTNEVSSDVVTDVATSPTDAIAKLEYALGSCGKGRRGMLHITTHLATYLFELSVIRREGSLILTGLDTIVVADAGYDGSGPYAAAADDSQWAYATGIVQVRLGPEHVVPTSMEEALNRSSNLVEYRAERQAAVAWDGCCHFAAEIDLGWAAVGS